MKQLVSVVLMVIVLAVPALAQFEVPPVSAPDDSIPVPGTRQIDLSSSPPSFGTSAGGVIIRDVALQEGLSPRLRIGTIPLTIQSTAAFSLSIDGGLSYRRCTCPAGLTIVPNTGGAVADPESIDVSITEFSLSGGTLPGGIMVRESPSKGSTGRYRLRESPTLSHLRSSFFDIFTEISLDGGATWTEASGALRLESKTVKPPILTTTPSPVAAGRYIGDLDGDGLPDLVVSFDVSSLPMPPVGSSQLVKLQSGFIYATAPAALRAGKDDDCDVFITHTYDDESGSHFDLELQSMPVSGGTLPSGLMIRESPSLPSRGKTEIVDAGSGQYRISSFFDVFTEISIDGGATWTPQNPMTLQFTDTTRTTSGSTQGCVSAATYPNDLYPPAGVMMPPRESPTLHFDNAAAVRWTLISRPAGSSALLRTLPPPGAPQVYDVDYNCDFQLDAGAGTGFSDVHTSGSSSVRITRLADDGDQRVYSMEMLSMTLGGGGGGQPVMVRESPSKSSLGRTTVRSNGTGYQIVSFFDIWPELSFDGGATWSASAESLHVEQVLFPEERTFATDNFPPPGNLKTVPACAATPFANGALVKGTTIFNTVSAVGLPPMGGGASAAAYAATGRLAFSVSLDGGSTFSSVVSDVTLTLQVTPGDSTPGGNYYDVEILAMAMDPGTGSNAAGLRLRESPTLASTGKLRLRESPTLSHLRSSFFDVFTEISLDSGATWSAASEPVHIELDTITGGAVAGTKWNDLNGNGLRDPGEPVLATWKVFLADTLGNVFDSTGTSASGDYSFSNIPPGTWRVFEDRRPGWIQTGGAPAYGFTIAPEQSLSGLDFGNFQAPALTGSVFNDHNANGVRDTLEQGLPGWQVCAAPGQNPNPGMGISGASASFSLHLVGGGTVTPVSGALDGSISLFRMRKRPEVLYQAWEDLDAPLMIQTLDLQGPADAAGTACRFGIGLPLPTNPSGGPSLASRKGWDGLIYGPDRPRPKPSGKRIIHIDLPVDAIFSPADPQSGQASGRRMHGSVPLDAQVPDDAADVDPLAPGTVYRTRTGNLIIFDDDAGIEAAVLDSLVITIGAPASSSQPVCTQTDAMGDWRFTPLPPGSWSLSAHIVPPYSPTNPPPPPVFSSGGARIPPIDFGMSNSKDTVKYRTFSLADWIAGAQVKSIKKPKPGKPGTGVPNLANVTEELFGMLGKGQSQVHVGVTGLKFTDGKTVRPSVVPASAKDVFATFYGKRVAHTDSIHRGLDFYNGGTKLIVKLLKNLPAAKQNNACLAELLALSCNLVLSDNGFTQEGLGELVFVRPGTLFDGMTVRQIASAGDQMMTVWDFRKKADYDALHDAAGAINNAFSCGGPSFACTVPVPLDTVYWLGRPHVRIRGRSPVSDVPFLRANPGAAPYSIPVTPPITEKPVRFGLNQNYPNPFNPTTMISFDLGAPSLVTLSVYNILGQEVSVLLNREAMDEGSQGVVFNAVTSTGNLPTGVYIVRLTAEPVGGNGLGVYTAVKKMMLMK